MRDKGKSFPERTPRDSKRISKGVTPQEKETVKPTVKTPLIRNKGRRGGEEPPSSKS